MESNGGMIMILIELAIWFVDHLASTMLVMAVRKYRFSMQEELLLELSKRIFLERDSLSL